MTNQEYLIAALQGDIDDGGASREAWINYYIHCPYAAGDRRCRCYPDDFRNGLVAGFRSKDIKEQTRELCVKCKAEWLESEVDE